MFRVQGEGEVRGGPGSDSTAGERDETREAPWHEGRRPAKNTCLSAISGMNLCDFRHGVYAISGMEFTRFQEVVNRELFHPTRMRRNHSSVRISIVGVSHLYLLRITTPLIMWGHDKTPEQRDFDERKGFQNTRLSSLKWKAHHP